MTTPGGGRREPTPGAPGGGAGAHSATAATFQVNDASLKTLRSTFQGLARDVRDFAKAIDELKGRSKTVDEIQAKLSGLGGGVATAAASGSGGRLAGMPAAPPTPAEREVLPPQAGAAAAGRSAGGGDRGGGGRLAGMGWVGSAASFGAKAAGSLLAAQGAYYQRRMGDITDLDLLFNQQAQNNGYGYREVEKSAARTAFFGAPGGQGAQGGIRGYQSAQDAMAGIGTVFGATGGSTSNRGMQALRNAGTMAALNPDAGLTGSANAMAQLYDPTVSARMMSIGVGPTVGMGGQLQSPSAIYQRVLQTVFRGRRPTANQIREGMQPGAPLYMTLTRGMGLGPDAVQQFERYAIAQANLGGNTRDTERAINAAATMQSGGTVSDADRRLAGRAGLDDSIRASQNALGAAGTRNTVEAGRQAEHTLERGFDALASATDKLTGSFTRLNDLTNGGVGVSGGVTALAGGPIGAGLGMLGGVGGAMFAWQQWRSRRRGGGPGGGGAGGAAGAVGDLAEDAISGGVQKVFVVNWGGGPGGPGGPGGTGPGGPGGGRSGRFGRVAGAAGAAARLGGAAVGLAGIAWGVGEGVQSQFEDEGRDLRKQVHDRQKERGENGALSGVNAWAKSVIHTGLGRLPGIGGALRRAIGTNDLDKAPGFDAVGGGGWGGSPRSMPFFSMDDPTPGGNPGFGYTAKPNFSGQPGFYGYSKGGVIPGNHDRDDVNIRTTPGEVVVPKHIVRRHGGAGRLMQKLGFTGGGGEGGHYAAGGEVTGDVEGLHPEFLKRLKAWSAAVGMPYKVGSGYRSLEEQKRLYDRWVRRVPGQAPAAKPGSSNHNFGLASDGPHWRSKNPEKFGLVYPMSYEPWHVEPIGAKNMRTGSGAPATASAEGTGASIPKSRNLVSVAAPSVGADEKSILARILGNVGIDGAARVEAAAKRAANPMGTDAAGAAVEAGAGVGAQPNKAPTNVNGNVSLGKQRAAGRGWTGGEWDALYALWQKESGWRHDAANPSSSARGIPQAMMSVHFGRNWQSNPKAQAWMSNPGAQIDWGLNYIAGRYRTPSKAWAHHQKMNWYERGAWETDDEVARVHREEMVVPAPIARKMRQAVRDRGSRPQSAAPIPVQGSGGGGVVVNLTAPITLAGRATQDDASRFVRMVTDKLEESDVLASLGSGS